MGRRNNNNICPVTASFPYKSDGKIREKSKICPSNAFFSLYTSWEKYEERNIICPFHLFLSSFILPSLFFRPSCPLSLSYSLSTTSFLLPSLPFHFPHGLSLPLLFPVSTPLPSPFSSSFSTPSFLLPSLSFPSFMVYHCPFLHHCSSP